MNEERERLQASKADELEKLRLQHNKLIQKIKMEVKIRVAQTSPILI